MTRNYRMTSTAETHLKRAVRETNQKWGTKQARKYNSDFLAGLQNIADNHHYSNSSHREKITKGTSFSLYLVEHRYVAFQEYGPGTIIIAGIFHEKMDISRWLKELETASGDEITALKHEIDKEAAGKIIKK